MVPGTDVGVDGRRLTVRKLQKSEQRGSCKTSVLQEHLRTLKILSHGGATVCRIRFTQRHSEHKEPMTNLIAS